VLTLEAFDAGGLAQASHGAVQHQTDHRECADGTQHHRRHAAVAGRALDGVLRLGTELLQLQPVVAHEQGQGLHLAHRVGRLDAHPPPSSGAQQRGAARHERHPTAAAEADLVSLSVFQQVRVEAEAGIDQEEALVDARHLDRRRGGVQQLPHGLGRVLRDAVCAREVVERALGDHAHGAARGVGGLCDRVERAIAADGDDRGAQRARTGRRPPCHRGKLGGVARQQLSTTPCGAEDLLDQLAPCLRITTACRRVDDELQWSTRVHGRAGGHRPGVLRSSPAPGAPRKRCRWRTERR
jgi:hypothetical protein